MTHNVKDLHNKWFVVKDETERLALPIYDEVTGEGYVTNGSAAAQTQDGKVYLLNNGTWEEFGAGDGGQIIQYEELPEPGEEWEGKIVQYIGPQDEEEGLYRGYFYECVEDEEDPGNYLWKQINIQPASSTSSAFIISIIRDPNNDRYIADKTPAEVKEADEAGKILIVHSFDGFDTDYYYQLYWKGYNEDDQWYSFFASETFGTKQSTLLTNIYLEKTGSGSDWTNIAFKVYTGQQFSSQVIIMPEANEDHEDEIVQYVGSAYPEYTNGYFYKCVKDSSTTPATFSWEAVNVQAGGSGSGSLGKAITAAIDVGGIEVGDEFAVGTSYDDMWDALLNPTLYPTFTAPSASLSYSADTYYEVKSSVSAKTATESLNRGSISPAYGTSGYRSGAATGYAIATSGADTEYSDSSSSSNIFNVPALTRSTKGNIVLTATVSYAAGEQPKDSKGNNYDSPLPAGSKTASKTLQFIQAYFYGKSSTPTVSSFSGLSKSVTAKGEKKFSYTTNNEYMVIAYDSSYGNLKTILDPNSFDVTSGWTKSTLTVDGFTYYVYVANSPTTDTNAQFTFKY